MSLVHYLFQYFNLNILQIKLILIEINQVIIIIIVPRPSRGLRYLFIREEESED